jgi:polyhydroxybutyrate depolymerase
MRKWSKSQVVISIVGVILLLAMAGMWLENNLAAKRAVYKPIDITNQVLVWGVSRDYTLHVPIHNGRKPLPVVLILHGVGDNAEKAAQMSQFNTLADKEKIIVAYPNGFSKTKSFSWNAGYCCGEAVRTKTDDATFLSNIVTDVSQKYVIDPKRVYIAGFSNGGMLVYQLWASNTGMFAAGVVVSGGVAKLSEPILTTGANTMSLLVIHGKNDWSIPYFGGVGKTYPTVNFLPFEKVKKLMTDRADCKQIDIDTKDKEVQVSRYGYCENNRDFVFYDLNNGVHWWPEKLDGGKSTNEVIWEFLKRHSLEE